MFIEKAKKIYPPTMIRNVSFAKPHPKEKDFVLILDHLMILMYRFVKINEKNLQKQRKVMPVSSNLFEPLFRVLLSQHP